MYNTQKVKSSFSILPDESSTDEHLKRSDLQTLMWREYDTGEMDEGSWVYPEGLVDDE
jgi:hypothetical protein